MPLVQLPFIEENNKYSHMDTTPKYMNMLTCCGDLAFGIQEQGCTHLELASYRDHSMGVLNAPFGAFLTQSCERRLHTGPIELYNA